MFLEPGFENGGGDRTPLFACLGQSHFVTRACYAGIAAILVLYVPMLLLYPLSETRSCVGATIVVDLRSLVVDSTTFSGS